MIMGPKPCDSISTPGLSVKPRSGYNAPMYRIFNDAVDSDLLGEALSTENFALPDPDLPAEGDGSLYDSRRSYFEQLAHYKAHREGGNGD